VLLPEDCETYGIDSAAHLIPIIPVVDASTDLPLGVLCGCSVLYVCILLWVLPNPLVLDVEPLSNDANNTNPHPWTSTGPHIICRTYVCVANR
jgi:hypothetical protein